MNDRCPNCGAPCSAGTAKCEYCGTPHAPAGPAAQPAPIPQPVYRYPTPQQNGNSSGKSRITAALLAVFLGCFGVHKFYLRKPIQGILMLAFCWTFVPSFIALVEFILLLCSTDREFAQKYDHSGK